MQPVCSQLCSLEVAKVTEIIAVLVSSYVLSQGLSLASCSSFKHLLEYLFLLKHKEK